MTKYEPCDFFGNYQYRLPCTIIKLVNGGLVCHDKLDRQMNIKVKYIHIY